MRSSRRNYDPLADTTFYNKVISKNKFYVFSCFLIRNLLNECKRVVEIIFSNPAIQGFLVQHYRQLKLELCFHISRVNLLGNWCQENILSWTKDI